MRSLFRRHQWIAQQHCVFFNKFIYCIYTIHLQHSCKHISELNQSILGLNLQKKNKGFNMIIFQCFLAYWTFLLFCPCLSLLSQQLEKWDSLDDIKLWTALTTGQWKHVWDVGCQFCACAPTNLFPCVYTVTSHTHKHMHVYLKKGFIFIISNYRG